MRIGELARQIGVDVETIRYYERAGLMPQPVRHPNGYRAYGHEHVERLAFIRHCRGLDIPLADIKRLLDLVAHPATDCGDADQLIRQHLERVRVRLTSLQALEKQLVALNEQCGRRQTAATCGILQELVSAAHGEACVCHASRAAGIVPRVGVAKE